MTPDHDSRRHESGTESVFHPLRNLESAIATAVLRTGTLVGLLASFLACSGSSPTDPPMPETSQAGLTITFPSAAAFSDDQQASIRALIEDTFARTSERIPLAGITVILTPGPRYLIPGWGTGGFAPAGGASVEIAVDPALTPALVEARVPSIAAHEFHHASRHRGPGYGHTLLEAMVSEGLADHFARELFGHPQPPWTRAISGHETDEWLERARLELDSAGYDHAAWFFGQSPTIPNWTGYTLGYELVGALIQSRSGASASSLVHASAEEFRPR